MGPIGKTELFPKKFKSKDPLPNSYNEKTKNKKTATRVGGGVGRSNAELHIPSECGPFRLELVIQALDALAEGPEGSTALRMIERSVIFGRIFRENRQKDDFPAWKSWRWLLESQEY